MQIANSESNFIPNGGVDIYEGSRRPFDPFVQITTSGVVDNMSQFTEGNEFTKVISPFSIESMHLYRNMRKDICTSSGIMQRYPVDNNVIRKNVF